MRIFRDIISGDELFSDSFPVKEVDDIVYEVQSKMITKEEGNYDIGANPSQEGGEEDEGVDNPGRVTVNAVIDAHRLQQVPYGKKDYMNYIKNYMKVILGKIKESNPQRVEIFQAKAQEFVKKVLGDFSNYDFYIGESGDNEAQVALLFYKEDGITPYFYFWKDGVVAEKV